MRQQAFFVFLALAVLATPACGRRPGLAAPDKVIKNLEHKPVASAARAADFPASVATLEVASANTSYLVVRFRASKLGFNAVSKVGFPVIVKGQEQFKSNLYLGADDHLYISDLGTVAKPRFWRVGAWGTPRFIAGKPQEGDTVNLRFDPGIVMDMGIDDGKESGKLGIMAEMNIKSTPPATSEPELWSAPLAEAL